MLDSSSVSTPRIYYAFRRGRPCRYIIMGMTSTQSKDRNKYTAQQKAEMLAKADLGMSAREIAEQYGAPTSTVYAILSRERDRRGSKTPQRPVVHSAEIAKPIQDAVTQTSPTTIGITEIDLLRQEYLRLLERCLIAEAQLADLGHSLQSAP